MEIFVGNLSFDANEADIQKLFEEFGHVTSVVILRRKEKKAPKSRGFGFVQMPDEQQALAAIAALQGREFMGRALDVSPARPKSAGTSEKATANGGKRPEPQAGSELKEHSAGDGGRGREPGKRWFNPVFKRTGAYKGGRRTHSYIKRRVMEGMPEEEKPRPRSQDNPMRWRKRSDKPRPWQGKPGEYKPWKKPAGESKPWRKSEGGSMPWKKTTGAANTWRKSEGGVKPWKKPGGRSRPTERIHAKRRRT